MNLLTRLQIAGSLATIAAFGALAFVAWRYFSGRNVLDVARDLKESTPLGLPSRALDAGISAATGREETLGGWLAGIFNPATRTVDSLYGTQARRVKPAAPIYPDL